MPRTQFVLLVLDEVIIRMPVEGFNRFSNPCVDRSRVMDAGEDTGMDKQVVIAPWVAG